MNLIQHKKEKELYVNKIVSKKGLVSPVCQCCGKKSRFAKPDNDEEPSIWNIAHGWSVAPFPSDEIHNDGSTGSTYTCPSCNKLLKSGRSLKLRNYSVNELSGV